MSTAQSPKTRPAVSVDSLSPADKEGFLTKQGGKWKNWKKRWMVLKGNNIFYFKTKKDKEATGVIELEKDSTIQKKDDKRKKYCFSVKTDTRTYFMYPDTQDEQEEWMTSIKIAIENLKANSTTSTTVSKNTTEKESVPLSSTSKVQRAGGPITRLRAAVKQIPFLLTDSKPLEFWEIWQDSVPDDFISFRVTVSLNLSQVSWRCVGPQSKLIQKMVDFFWNVGAPETEIDKLNEVGTSINPSIIGSWIDMSSKGGMDGGWYFPCGIPGIPINAAMDACDMGDASEKVFQWATKHNYDTVQVVGRDMGAAPPRQTHFEFTLRGDFNEQLQAALTAYHNFGLPVPPDDALEIIKSNPKPELSLSVVISSEGFVKLGLITPKPEPHCITQLCSLSGSGNLEMLDKFEKALGVDGVENVEYKYLVKGFGYGVYKEGFDVVFHYVPS